MRINLFKSLKFNDDSDNGGIISETPIISNRKNNVLPDITSEEVSAGLTRYRKIFLVPEIQIPLFKIYLRHPSTSQDQALIRKATYTDTQDDADDYTLWKGSGTLQTSLTAGSISTIVVQSENTGAGFNPLDLIRLSDGTNEDFIRIYSVSWNGAIATLTCPSSSYLSYDFLSGSYVSSCIEKGVIDITAIWLKEVVPVDIAYHRNNINRIRFLA